MDRLLTGLAFFYAVEEAFVKDGGLVNDSGNQRVADGYDVTLPGYHPGLTDAYAPNGMGNADDASCSIALTKAHLILACRKHREGVLYSMGYLFAVYQ